MQQGELIVTGTGKATITLNKFPSEVKVHFKHELELVPCNSQNADTLECEVQSDDNVTSGFVLVISWAVTGVREVKWHAYY